MAITISGVETSNRDWNYDFEVRDDETGELIDFTGAMVAIGFYDQDGCQKIIATTANGKITSPSIGVISLRIPYAETSLCAGSYDVGGYYQINGETLDLLEGDLTVRAGRPKP